MNRVTVIVPCAGNSTRYPNVRPKFLLVNPSGNLMLFDSISKLDLKNCDLVVTILGEHNEKYEIPQMLNKFFSSYKVRLCILNKPTKSQSETVYKTIKNLKISGPILIKDSDNIFKLDKIYEPYNYVAVEHLKNVGITNAVNKSYTLLDDEGIIRRIAEKQVISETFCVGGYYFTNVSDFTHSFEILGKKDSEKELYVSMIIKYLIEEKKVLFKSKSIQEYLDLGTIKEWLHYKSNQKTYFIDVDGVVVKNGGQYCKPFWGTTEGLPENIKVINRLFDLGNYIILITSRKEKYRQITVKQLKREGVKYHQLIMDLNHSSRVVINDFSKSNPFPAAISVNIPRDFDRLGDYIND
ncbi:hypothetical protein HYW41_01980 [Candidatus Daviesbacteria bacterium]|nr:hypothetical protein [Candidatus Daviesbacteria bacterium]